MDSAQAEELARRVTRWVSTRLEGVSGYNWNTETLVLTITNEVFTITNETITHDSHFTLDDLVLDDAAQFAQFAQFEPSPDRVEASQILMDLHLLDAGAFPLPFPYLHSSLDSMFCLCCRSRTRTRRSCSFS